MTGAEIEAENAAIDAIVGNNIRARRKALGLTQQNIADHLGMTFQQVQKYERGTNRVAASTMWRMASVLRCGLDDLFTGAPGGPSGTTGDVTQAASVARLLAENGGPEFAEAFAAVPPKARRPLIAIANALGAGRRH